jgi:ribosome-binding protein aMBF1 (putative translation factor)
LLHGGAGAEQKAAIRRPKRRLHAATRTDAAKAVSKLDQFPSPQPLTKEERMLAEYVGQHYHEAVLIARAQEEASRKDLEEERRYSKGNRDDDDDDDDDSQQSK